MLRGTNDKQCQMKTKTAVREASAKPYEEKALPNRGKRSQYDAGAK